METWKLRAKELTLNNGNEYVVRGVVRQRMSRQLTLCPQTVSLTHKLDTPDQANADSSPNKVGSVNLWAPFRRFKV